MSAPGSGRPFSDAIAGGLLGVIHGPAGIPDRWRRRLEYADRLTEAAAEIERIRAEA